MSHEIILTGCSPTPLASYLKALGIFRLVAAQDENVKGFWRGEHFVLENGFDKEQLKHFLQNEYAPTPVVAPWNGGSGFFEKDNKTALEAIALSSCARLGDYRLTIETARRILKLFGVKESPKDEAKSDLLTKLRARFPETSLDWMDAAVLLSGDVMRFPPLLGTGGNDGRLDFTNNFMQRVCDVMDTASGRPTESSLGWLDQALFSKPSAFLTRGAIGQFSPGQVGGPNSVSGFEADSLMNPWDFVLMIEGALLFAASASRKHESSDGSALSFPFTVRPTGAGSGSLGLSDEAPARAEIWLPLWVQPMTYLETRSFLSEGRVTVGRRPARDGLDFVRAVNRLAYDRGIEAFQRVGFLMRSGKAYLATPITRIKVQHNSQSELIDELDRAQWLSRFRRFAKSDNAATRFTGFRQRFENALFDLAQRREHPPTVQTVLIALSEIQQALAVSTKARESVAPVPTLFERWVIAADDQSIELRVACALASLRGTEELPLPLRAHMAPVHPKSNDWMDAACKELQSDALCRHRLHVWHHGGLVENLANVLDRRLLLAQQLDFQDKPLAGYCGCELEDVGAFLTGSVNDERIAALAAGIALCRMPENLPPREQNGAPLLAAYALLRVLFTQDSVLRRLKVLPADKSLPIPPGLLRLLQANRVDAAIERAAHRLRASGVPAFFHARNVPSGRHLDGMRLAASLLIPLSFRATARIVRSMTQGEIEDAAETIAPV
ncbi:MAG: type I-U CRISPR-associated protein Csx17 [Betaproteobacteria bacterium]|nr:type I-U CRISPR-associated protein Csx17 [Betaproteobacteria bacterium]